MSYIAVIERNVRQVLGERRGCRVLDVRREEYIEVRLEKSKSEPTASREEAYD